MRNNWAKNTALIAMGTVVALVIAEIILALFFKEQFDTRRLQEMRSATNLKGLIQPSSNPEINFELIPGLNVDFHGTTVKTDEDGYRILDKDQPAPKEGLRIAVLGDSTPFGWRVEYADTYAEQLRRTLEIETQAPIIIKNFSVPNYNAEQELHVFHEKIVPFKPDLLILHHDHNDSQPTGFGLPPGYLPPEYGDNALNSTLVKFAIRQYASIQNRIKHRSREDEHQYVAGYAVSGPLYDNHLAALESLAKEAAALKIPIIAVLFIANVTSDPQYQKNEIYLSLHKPLAEKLDGFGMRVLDLYPLYQAKLKAEA